MLAEGDDQQDPIADSARAILDGHVVLSRHLAEAATTRDRHRSIDFRATSLITPQQFSVVRRFKQTLSRYQRNRDLIAVGAYVAGNDPQLDDAIARYPRLEAFLQQDIGENVGYQDAVNQLQASFELRTPMPSQLPWTC